MDVFHRLNPDQASPQSPASRSRFRQAEAPRRRATSWSEATSAGSRTPVEPKSNLRAHIESSPLGGVRVGRSSASPFISREPRTSLAQVIHGDSNASVDPCVCRRSRVGGIGSGGPAFAQPGINGARRLTADRAGFPGLRVGLAPRPLAGPLGLLALGALLSCTLARRQVRPSLCGLARPQRRLG
jgi:hypothetical protein